MSVRAGRVMAAGDAEAVVVIEGPAGWLVRAHGQAQGRQGGLAPGGGQGRDVEGAGGQCTAYEPAP